MKLNNNDDSHNSGLNLLIYNMLLDIESHPTWVCGLKLYSTHPYQSLPLSHPTWVCGLKLLPESYCISFAVTPYVGVWIETLKKSNKDMYDEVTPYVGVWIETLTVSMISARE